VKEGLAAKAGDREAGADVEVETWFMDEVRVGRTRTPTRVRAGRGRCLRVPRNRRYQIQVRAPVRCHLSAHDPGAVRMAETVNAESTGEFL